MISIAKSSTLKEHLLFLINFPIIYQKGLLPVSEYKEISSMVSLKFSLGVFFHVIYPILLPFVPNFIKVIICFKCLFPRPIS